MVAVTLNPASRVHLEPRIAQLMLQTHVQHEPEAREGTTTVENTLCSTGAENTAPKGPQQLQAGGSLVKREAGPCPSLPSGELFYEPTSVS